MFRKKPYILTIGAYERDNFGDLLFFLVLKKYLGRKYHLVPGSTIDIDMTPLLGEKVLAYPEQLRSKEWHAVWVVGGEIGGVTPDTAMVMNFGRGKENREQKETALSRGKGAMTLAYLPSKSSLSQATKFVVNSVGLSGISLVDESVRQQALKSLKAANGLIVRDTKSFQLLSNMGLKSRLKPDVVHAISKIYPRLKKPKALTGQYILVQISEDIVTNTGIDETAASLDRLQSVSQKNIVLFLAGTAYSHDSVDTYRKIQKKMTTPSTVFSERNPEILAAAIRHSNMWIGSSLHGRIIASSYAVPRISIAKAKVTDYAECWDKKQPYNVKVADIALAYKKAIALPQDILDHEARRLTDLSFRNLEWIKNEIL